MLLAKEFELPNHFISNLNLPNTFYHLFFPERPKAERDKTPPEQRRQQAHHPGLADEGQERPREEELVRAHWQNVPLLQVAGRPGNDSDITDHSDESDWLILHSASVETEGLTVRAVFLTRHGKSLIKLTCCNLI